MDSESNTAFQVQCFNVEYDESITGEYDEIVSDTRSTKFLAEVGRYLKELCKSDIRMKTGDPKSYPRLFIGAVDSYQLDYYPISKASFKNTGLNDDDQYMVLYFEGPSNVFKAANMSGPEKYYLCVNFGISEYYPRQKGSGLTKEIYLGTNNSFDVSWSTGLNKSVEVCQFTAILMDSGGKVINAGAEGIFALNNSFMQQTLNIRTSFNENLFEMLEKHTVDVEGERILAWQNALSSLVGRMTKQLDVVR